jgi:hypothetical protein
MLRPSPKHPGYYFITSKISGLNLDVCYASQKVGDPVCQATEHEDQVWHLEPSSKHPGYYFITSAISGLNLDDCWASKNVGAKMCQAAPHEDQVWEFLETAPPNPPGIGQPGPSIHPDPAAIPAVQIIWSGTCHNGAGNQVYLLNNTDKPVIATVKMTVGAVQSNTHDTPLQPKQRLYLGCTLGDDGNRWDWHLISHR